MLRNVVYIGHVEKKSKCFVMFNSFNKCSVLVSLSTVIVVSMHLFF